MLPFKNFINNPLIANDMECRICRGRELREFLSLGKTPLANSFLSKDELAKGEDSFPLALCFCPRCKLVQLTHVVAAEKMFRNYVYLSSTTNTFRVHFTKMGEDISKEFGLGKNSLAVDIGSNDGILLKGFQKANVQTVGVEPATNIAKIAEQNGVETINNFFSKEVVQEIISRKGHADVVTATNVFAHINDIDAVATDVKALLKTEGIFVIEIQYIVDMIEKMTFDNIYHEHVSFYSLTSLDYFFRKHGMQIFNVERNDSHGGTLRAFMKKSGSGHKISPSVKELLDYEENIGIKDFKIYKDFADRVYGVKEKLVSSIKKIKGQGKKIAAYGAPAKGNTLLNFCRIGSDYIDYVVDDNPLKVGLYTPGTHIPVVNSKHLEENVPDYILVLAWNFAKEILEKTRGYREKGVRFIIPLPEFVIV